MSEFAPVVPARPASYAVAAQVVSTDLSAVAPCIFSSGLAFPSVIGMLVLSSFS